ncbi:MAG: hypothetical protein JXA33_12455, partial [Anaerolineae bacterium]|nr:hypothetical protein [Anaerolineae bacterium]
GLRCTMMGESISAGTAVYGTTGLGGSGVAVGRGVIVDTGSGVGVVLCGIRLHAKAVSSSRLSGSNSQVFRFILPS